MSDTRKLHQEVTYGEEANDHAGAKLIWLIVRDVQDKWNMPPIKWQAVMSQFAIHFENRFVIST